MVKSEADSELAGAVNLRACPVAAHAKIHPDDAAIIAGDGRSVSYRDLDHRIEIAVSGLNDFGLKRGDRLAIRASTGLDLIALLVACFRSGVVAVPLNLRLPTSSIEVDGATVGASAIVVDERVDIDPSIRQLLLADLFAADPSAHAPHDDVWALDEPASVVFTSGSTGESKAVLHSLGNHVFNAEGSRANIALERGHRWLLALPLYHVGGLAIVFRCILAGATIVLPRSGESLADALARLHPTHISLVATQLTRLIDSGFRDDEHHLNAILLGGSAIPVSLIDRALKLNLPIHTSYGMSEMASQITTTPPGADRSTLATSGRLLPHRELHIEESHVYVRGRTRFLGYLSRRGIETPFDENGWFKTGDTGYLDDERRLVITGRVDDMFISGGENIQPGRIERVLSALPEIKSAMVVPVPDDEFGERPVAFIETALEIKRDDISKRLRERLPGFMIPVAYFPMPEESGPSFKRSRRDLKALARKLVERG